MRKRNSVKQLGRTHAHRKAMFNNMVTSLLMHERIVTTKQKSKELKKITDKLITRAKKNLFLSDKEEDKKLHNKREAMKFINNRNVVKKLFEEIAVRNKERPGGYTRIYLLGRRPGDAAEMAIIELVEREKQVKAETKEAKKEEKEAKKIKKDKKDLKEKADKNVKAVKAEKKGKAEKTEKKEKTDKKEKKEKS